MYIVHTGTDWSRIGAEPFPYPFPFPVPKQKCLFIVISGSIYANPPSSVGILITETEGLRRQRGFKVAEICKILSFV
jgi:hypothetical protein